MMDRNFWLQECRSLDTGRVEEYDQFTSGIRVGASSSGPGRFLIALSWHKRRLFPPLSRAISDVTGIFRPGAKSLRVIWTNQDRDVLTDIENHRSLRLVPLSHIIRLLIFLKQRAVAEEEAYASDSIWIDEELLNRNRVINGLVFSTLDLIPCLEEVGFYDWLADEIKHIDWFGRKVRPSKLC